MTQRLSNASARHSSHAEKKKGKLIITNQNKQLIIKFIVAHFHLTLLAAKKNVQRNKHDYICETFIRSVASN